jgi:hypothetical protein
MLTAYDSAIKINMIAKLSEALMTHSQWLMKLFTAIPHCTASIYPFIIEGNGLLAPQKCVMH